LAGAAVAVVAWRVGAPDGTSARTDPAATRGTTSDDIGEPMQDAAIASAGRREPGGCAVVFDGDDAHVSEEAVLRAALDPSGRADCHGHAVVGVATFVRRAEAQVGLLRALSGDGEDGGSLEAAGLGSSVVARITVGKATASSCGASAGFIAVLTLRGRRLAVDAIGPWTAPCTALEPITFAKLGSGRVLLEDDGEETSDVDARGVKRVWAFRDETLVQAGEILIDRALDDRTMEGELVVVRDALVVHETWSPRDGGASWITDRRYRVRDWRVELVP